MNQTDELTGSDGSDDVHSRRKFFRALTVAGVGGAVLLAAHGEASADAPTGVSTLLDAPGIPASPATNDCSAALNAALAITSDLIIPAGTFRISTNLTVPIGKHLRFLNGASLSVDSGKTLTINGTIDAQMTQIFTGAGVVVGLRFVRPEWFGAIGNWYAGAGNNDTLAIKAAVYCAQNSGGYNQDRPVVKLASKNYMISETIELKAGWTRPIALVGEGQVDGSCGGTRIWVYNVGNANTAIAVSGGTAAGQPNVFELSNFSINNAYNGQTAIRVGYGGSGVTSNGLSYSRIQDINVEGFVTGLILSGAYGIHLQRCHVQCTASGSVALRIEKGSGDSGDLFFDACVFQTSTTNSNVVLITGGLGLHFKDCTFYGGSKTLLIAAAGSQYVGDVWFMSCAWDAGQSTPFPSYYVWIEPTFGGEIRNIQFVANHFRGCADTMIVLNDTSASGRYILDVRVVQCWAQSANGFFFSCVGGKNIMVESNILADIGLSQLTAIFFRNVERFVCTNNMLRSNSGTAGTTSMVYVDGAMSTKYVITGNTGVISGPTPVVLVAGVGPGTSSGNWN